MKPFALINCPENTITVIIGSKLRDDCEQVGFHPAINTTTTVITSTDFFTFLESIHQSKFIVEFSEDEYTCEEL